ncbi:hypothetical protein JMJ56_24265 [Belnapia sp. T18]|uniref:Uncharacterized protein n=1 Tax=Belnapia arida TaxID=2804533 RepID=A0ABS1U8V9_9PROT|nr:hypothetical protein [Belnapia arida]MBL6081122.1 hypothetical protein [Belnapia arida]
MSGDRGLVPRLEALFGGVWQAALDRAGIMSRRRARDIGAGEEPSGALWVVVELLERLPPTEWPERWRGLGKVAETCPTLAMHPEQLVDGRIRREDAVLVWDLLPGSSGVPPRHVNVTVGYLPRGCFAGMPRADVARTRWRLWYGQWDECHGAPAPGWMAAEDQTPEGMLAAWVAEGALGGADLEAAVNVLSARIADFSLAHVAKAMGRAAPLAYFGAEVEVVSHKISVPSPASRPHLERR